MQEKNYEKTCPTHGALEKENILIERVINGFNTRCKLCRVESRLKNALRKTKVCKHHGELKLDDIRINARGWTSCRICHRKSASKKRNANRAEFNAKVAQDKINNPEKWEKIFKKDYEAKKKKFGNLLSLHKCCQARGITIEQYNEMLKKQNGKCAICEQEETRKCGVTKGILRLSIDHCHKTNKVRGLLCHDCNTGIGKFKDKTGMILRALLYVRAHQ